jgi:hypothetical protein
MKKHNNIASVFQLIKSKKDVHNFPETSGTRVETKCQFLECRENEKIWYLAKTFTKKSKIFIQKWKKGEMNLAELQYFTILGVPRNSNVNQAMYMASTIANTLQSTITVFQLLSIHSN